MFTILVVESDCNLLKLYQQELGEEGYRVIGCASASEAQMNLSHLGKIHLVLLEMHSSIQHGARLLRDLVAKNLNLRVIHNAGDVPITANAMTAYADERLSKSGDLAPLVVVIRRLLRLGACNVQTAWHDAVGLPTFPILQPVGMRLPLTYDVLGSQEDLRRRRKRHKRRKKAGKDPKKFLLL